MAAVMKHAAGNAAHCRQTQPETMLDQPSILLAFDWYDRRVYRGIVRYASERNWHLSPYLFSDRFVPQGWPGDGAITCYGRTLGKFISSLDMPKVDVSVCELPEPVPRVNVDDARIGQLAAEHFLERGFHHFAFYSWPLIEVNRFRRETFFKALTEAGVEEHALHEIKQSPARVLGDWEQHQAAILDQIGRLPRPVAVFAGQDNLGATLIEICVRKGIHVPEEVSVLGVDDIEFLCECLAVPLSSIDTRLEDLGYRAAEQLDRLMRGEISRDEPRVLVSPKGVVSRQSTDVLAVPHPAVVQALKFVKENYHRPITLEDIAEHAGMSKRGMEKAFIKYLRRTPAAELRRLRLDNAKRMLTETDEKIDTVARECGYSNSSNLSFAFNRETGMSPRAYRYAYRGRESE
jgi:LacI family transcriptional regulator